MIYIKIPTAAVASMIDGVADGCARAATGDPVLGFLRSTSPEGTEHLLAAFRQGLKETGYVEGQNLAVKYRWANI